MSKEKGSTGVLSKYHGFCGNTEKEKVAGRHNKMNNSALSSVLVDITDPDQISIAGWRRISPFVCPETRVERQTTEAAAAVEANRVVSSRNK